MKLFTYISGDKKSHFKLGKELSQLKPGEYIIEVRKNRPIRSISQNKFYWALIKLVATDTGHTSKEIDNMFRMDRHFEVVEYPNGKTITIPKDTHDLDTKEFTAVVNNLMQWIQENFPHIIIPRKEDLTYRQWMEIERSYADASAGF